MGGGGGGPTSSTVNQSNLPEYARPYFERMMGRAEEESNQPYVPYNYQRLADFTSDARRGFDVTRGLEARGMPEIDLAGQAAAGSVQAGLPDISASRDVTMDSLSRGAQQMQGAQSLAAGAGNVGAGDINTARTTNLGSLATAMQGMQGAMGVASGASQVGASDIGTGRSMTTGAISRGGMETEQNRALAGLSAARGLEAGNYRSNAIQQQAFGRGQAQQYMSPYIEEVMNRQKAAAVRDFDEGRASRDTAAIRSGAFGGYRAAIQEGVAQRGLGERLSNIEAIGRQQAFENAQAQFERDRMASMSAQGTTEAQRLAAAQYGLSGANLGLQGAQAMGQFTAAQQAAALQGGQAMAQMGSAERDAALRQAGLLNQIAAAQHTAGLQSSQAIGQLGMSQRDAAIRQAGLVGQLAASEQDLGLRGGESLARLGASQQNAALQQAQALGRVGSDRQTLTLRQADALQRQGSVQRQQQQSEFDLAYGDFLRQQEARKQQINFMSNILRGVPVQPTQVQNTYANPNPLAQFGGLGIAGLGLMRS